MWRPLDPRVSTTGLTGLRVRAIDQHEYDLWALTAASGWSESPEAANFMRTFAQVNAYRRESVSFIAEREGQPIATGALSVSGGVALLAGASTVPHARNKGAQRALLDSRLQYAREHGCDIAMMCALPGSASQRNAEREGFRIAYTRLKWQLAATPG
jgi:GNAT superfamily N-acetyltransferase